MNFDLFAIAWGMAWLAIDVLCIATAAQIRKIDRSRMSLVVSIGAIMMVLSHLTTYVTSGLILNFSASPSDAFLSTKSVFYLLKMGGFLGLFGMALFASGIFVLARRHAMRMREFDT